MAGTTQEAEAPLRLARLLRDLGSRRSLARGETEYVHGDAVVLACSAWDLEGDGGVVLA